MKQKTKTIEELLTELDKLLPKYNVYLQRTKGRTKVKGVYRDQ